ncbi:hypothetical protein IW140_002718 [Coemansia sp. RSA 1813]|nr:hypothetical protein EV178_000205 [Coemansia sp. RSA 1646]KAJ1769547.1 hypothetical protein LPJ74_003968 [Coemansia sp. RSA 1843]KAJ2090487.1 hypothetical protein IW138_002699 [Coemansia sp. RSA 986]KAJ2215453.1 hypothetical protein EV179_002238 [Coemansia sp. RSA 487]KAJ2570040.1 hypothetical protein IW140_002718 [Coemansia sp. RSA 1813]
MGVSHKEENFVVIELGSHTTKAVLDTSDINKLPTVVIRTRAGILKNSGKDDAGDGPPSQQPRVNGSMDVDPTESMERSDLPTEQAPPSNATNGTASVDEPQNEASDSSTKDAEQDGNDTSYMFGSALDSTPSDALDGTVDMVVGGLVQDWDALSAFLRHIVTKELGIHISRNINPILFSIPALWPKADLENLVQVAFEHLNAPTIVISEQPLAALYGNGKMSGLVVDIGHTTTTVTPIVDSYIQSSTIAQCNVAGAAVTKRLQELLQADSAVSSQFDAGTVSLEFAEALKESGLCRLRLVPPGSKEDAGEEEDSGASEFEYHGKKYKISKEILLKAPEIVVNPTEQGAVRLTTLMQQAALACDPEKRTTLWENISIVGGSSRFRGLKEYLQSELETTVLPGSNIFALSQTREIKFLSIPDYFAGWRNHDHWAGFLGACIMEKISMNDAKYNMTRAEYNDGGPSIVHTKPS